MWYLLYNVLLILASPFILLILLAKKRCRPGLAERLGLFGLSGLFRLFGQNSPNRPNRLNRPDEPVIWIHAVSLGEGVAAVPLGRLLHSRYPEYRLVVSTVTDTGREAGGQRLGRRADSRAAHREHQIRSARARAYRPAGWSLAWRDQSGRT